MPDHTGAPAPQAAVFILCPSGLRTIRAVADEVEDHLAAQGIRARVLLYGVSTKRRDGFLLVEGAKSIPSAFIRWLNDDEDILDFVVYDVPSYEQEHQAPARYQREQEP